MTDHEIIELLAREVMGWKRKTIAEALCYDPSLRDETVDDGMDQLDNKWYDGDKEAAYVEDEGMCREEYEKGWNPLESIADAWMIVEKMRGKTNGFSMERLGTCDSWWCFFSSGEDAVGSHSEHDNPARAICLAALSAIRNKGERP